LTRKIPAAKPFALIRVIRGLNSSSRRGFPKNRYQIFQRFCLLLPSARENQFDFILRVSERINNPEEKRQCSG
jgi:hypothetical protein